MIARLLSLTALSVALATPALAIEEPQAGKHDSRIRYVDYDPANIVDIWTTPGAIMTLEFAADETIAGVAVSDSDRLKVDKRKNFLILKPRLCLQPEPIVVLTNLPDGSLRRYSFQIETHPEVCEPPAARPSTSATPVSATTNDPPQQQGNIRYISPDALADGSNTDYVVQFQYPSDEAAKRRAAAHAAAEKWRKEKASRILGLDHHVRYQGSLQRRAEPPVHVAGRHQPDAPLGLGQRLLDRLCVPRSAAHAVALLRRAGRQGVDGELLRPR